MKKIFLLCITVCNFSCGSFSKSTLNSVPETTRISFDSIDDLHDIFGDKLSAYRGLGNCGSVRIHDEESIFLTSLHCFSRDLESSKEIHLGSEIDSDSLVYFDDNSNVIVRDNLKILSHGGCYTGLGLDVLSFESKENQELAIKCALGDWLIYEELSQDSSTIHPKCAVIGEQSIGSAAYVLGASKSEITRNGLTRTLSGRVYSKGSFLDFESLKNPELFPFTDVVSFLFESKNINLLKKSMLLSDTDVAGGMSGGPILDQNFNLVGVTTLKIAPNGLWRYDGFTSHDDDLGASHGGIRSQEIINQLVEKGKSNLFQCR